MQTIEAPTELKVIGFDQERPPKIQRRPCIDLYFRLNEEAPEEWCKCFMNIIGKQTYSIKIDPEVSEFVETWVRKTAEIENSLETVKRLVAKGNQAYQESLEAKRKQAAVVLPDEVISPEQLRLNDVVAGLVFDE